MKIRLSCIKDFLLAYPRARTYSTSSCGSPSVIEAVPAHVAQYRSARSCLQKPTQWPLHNKEVLVDTVQPSSTTVRANQDKLLDEGGPSSFGRGLSVNIAGRDAVEECVDPPAASCSVSIGLAQPQELLKHNSDILPLEDSSSRANAPPQLIQTVFSKPDGLPELIVQSRRPLTRILRARPKIRLALREKRYRQAIHFVLQDRNLRKNEDLISEVRLMVQEHAGGRAPPKLLSKQVDFAGLGLTDLALRLGMAPSGYMRGTEWEKLHREQIWENGILPKRDSLMDALRLDLEQGTMKRISGPHKQVKLGMTSVDNSAASSSINITARTQRVNSMLSTFLRRGSRHRDRLGHLVDLKRQEPIKSSKHRPTARGSQLDRLMEMIAKHRQRGFRPDHVTANIVVKCWLRTLVALDSRPSTSTSLNQNSPFPRPENLRQLVNACHCSISISGTESDRNVRHQSYAYRHPLPSFHKHIKPLGKTLIKDSRNKGDWMSADKLVEWLAVMRDKIDR